MGKRQKLVFSPPERDAPGYLRRMRMVAKFQQQEFGSDEATPEFFNELVEFMADFIIKPKKRELVKKLLWDASEEEFDKMLEALAGSTEDTSPKEETAPQPMAGAEA